MKEAFYKGIFVSIFSIVLNFAFKIITSHLIEKSELALYFTAVDIFTLTLLVLVGFRSSMVVAFAQLKNPQMIVNIFRGVVVVMALLVWAFVIPYLKHKVGVHVHYWYLVATVLSMSFSLYLANLLAMYRFYSTINHISILEPMMVLVWFLIAYYGFDLRSVQPLFIATVMSSLGISVYIYNSRKKDFPNVLIRQPLFDAQAIKFLKNSVISTIEFGSGIVLLYMVVVILMRYYTTSELGDFQVVTKPIFSYMVMIFVFPIFRFVLPELSKLIAQKDIAQIIQIRKWILKYALGVGGVFVLFSFFVSDLMVEALFPTEYANASLMIKHVSLFFVFLILNSYQVAFIKASGAFLSALFIRILGVVSLLGIFYFIYNFYSTNVISVIVALVSSYVVMFAVSFFLERKILRTLIQV